MEFSASDIASMINGTVEGDANIKINTIEKIEEASSGSLTFLANPAYASHIYNCGASIALVANDFKPEQDLPAGLTLVRVENPYLALAELLKAYDKLTKPQAEISDRAYVHPEAQVGENVYIGPFAFIGKGAKIGNGAIIHNNVSIGDNVTIGDESVINSNCNIYHGCVVGKQCIIHSGTVVGADGFGFAPNGDGFVKVPQVGNVIIEDFVEIGANCCIDRATLGSTILRKYAKLDNFIQIAHNVEVGENTVIAAQTGIAGSTKIGKNCMFGGQVGIIGHLTIADEVKIAAQSGIGASITEKGTIMQGSPAITNREFKRSYLYFTKLPQIKSKIDDLEKRLDQS